MNVIKKRQGLTSLIDRHATLVINVYRGAWCPFCRKYLKQLNHAFTRLPKKQVALYGVSVDLEGVNDNLTQ